MRSRLLLLVALLVAAAASLGAVSINPTTGQVAQGVGGGTVSVDNRPLDGGGQVGWYDATHIAYQHIGADGLYVALVDVTTGAVTRASGHAANNVVAGGGVWAAWLGDHVGTGLFTSNGFSCGTCGLADVGPDGAVAYVPEYQAGVGIRVRERDGSTWTLTDQVAIDVELLGSHRAVWRETTGLRLLGIPTSQTVSPRIWRPRVTQLPSGEWWIAYWCDEKGLVLHPFNDARHGYVIRSTPDAFNHDARAIAGTTIRVAFATNASEGPGSVIIRDVDVAHAPRVDLTVATPASPPAPAPPPPPASAPTSMPNHQAELQQLRAQYPAVITIDQDAELLARFAYQLRDQGFGVLRKDGGHNCAARGVAVKFSCDWIIYQPTNQGCDVIGNSPDVGNPTPATIGWCDGDPNPGEFVKVTTDPGSAAAGPVATPPPPPAPDCLAVQAQLAQANADRDAARQQASDLQAQHDALQAQVDQLNAQLATLKAKPAPSCEAKVPSWVKALGGKVGCTVIQREP